MRQVLCTLFISFTGALAAAAYTGSVCAVTDGSLIFNARGPTPQVATDYAEKACRIYGKNPGQCNERTCQVVRMPQAPKPSVAVIAVYDVAKRRLIPTSRVIPPPTKPSVDSSAPSRSAPARGHCANNGPTYSKDCFWIKAEDSNSCVPTSSSSDWIICRPLTRFGPAVCSNEKRCTWSD